MDSSDCDWVSPTNKTKKVAESGGEKKGDDEKDKPAEEAEPGESIANNA